MHITLERGQHSRGAASYFNENELDAFMRADVLSALFGDRWYSVLISDNDRALLHAFVPSAIADTGLFDVEPWFGYAGPLLRGDGSEFVARALETYRDTCRQLQIVAELVRFEPIRENHLDFCVGLSHIAVVDGVKAIVYVPIVDDDASQLAQYAPPGRQHVRAARKNLHFARLPDSPEAWRSFSDLYHQSLYRVGAEQRWYFSGPFLERLRNASPFSLWGVYADQECRDDLVSAAIVVAVRDIAYYFLAANGDVRTHKGANDLLIHETARALQREGIRWFCLGGGNSDADNDPLLVFKRKFSAAVRKLQLGFWAHDQGVLDGLYREAAAQSPASAEARLFLRYRLAPRFAPGRMEPAVLE